MRSRVSDTDLEAERVQLDLLGRAGGGRRARMALSLSATVIDFARRAIWRSLQRPTEEEVGLRFVELHYGVELATELRRYLATRRA